MANFLAGSAELYIAIWRWMAHTQRCLSLCRNLSGAKAMRRFARAHVHTCSRGPRKTGGELHQPGGAARVRMENSKYPPQSGGRACIRSHANTRTRVRVSHCLDLYSVLHLEGVRMKSRVRECACVCVCASLRTKALATGKHLLLLFVCSLSLPFSVSVGVHAHWIWRGFSHKFMCALGATHAAHATPIPNVKSYTHIV